MEFTKFHKEYFSSNSGAFSEVTERENYDSQITVTDYEAAMVIEYFGINNIQLGNVQSNRLKSEKNFLLYPLNTRISLNLVFPKSEKPELRLYLSHRKGFKPRGGMIWFIFINQDDQLVIGFMDKKEWDKIGQIDIEDEEYQNNIEEAFIKEKKVLVAPEGKIARVNIGPRISFGRDPKIAIMRFQEVGYKCEIHHSHETFISLATNLPYMEAHHFIPIKYQGLFKEPLDSFYNVTSLCPTCHRAIHHATVDFKLHLIKNIYEKRPQLHHYTLDDISQFYNCIRPDK
jgi:5-methylcytosine-specific restriction protein A